MADACRAADVAAMVGREGRLVNSWLRRRAKARGDVLEYRPGPRGGTELWVTEEYRDAAVAFYGLGFLRGDESVATSPATAGEPLAKVGDEPPVTAGESVADAPAQMPQALAPDTAALIAEAAEHRGRSEALAGEVAHLRGELAAAREALRESDLARGHMSARVGQMLDAWRDWRAEFNRAGRVALWRRRLPADPLAFERPAELAPPKE